MDAGNSLREKTRRGDLLALYAASEISALRRTGPNGAEPLQRTIHLLHSLKNPGEVTALRQIYGLGFFLIGVYSPEVGRIDYLTKKKRLKPHEASRMSSFMSERRAATNSGG
jgi:hypothetical protein